MAGEARANKIFEPPREWKYEEDKDILDIHLQREQLGIKLSESGTLIKIFGERPNASKEAEFYIEITLPRNTYITQEIRAKFESSHLYITMPKINRETKDKISSEPSQIDRTPKQEVTKDQSIVAPPPPPLSHDIISGDKVQQMPSLGENTLPKFEFHGHNPPMLGLRVGEMAMSVAAMAVAISVLVAYVVYMYKSTFDGI
ncbi:hypothetical protein OROGR_029653 [Orobanche gracilis]